MANDLMQEMNQALQTLRGMPCWHFSTGGAVGSTFQLALGKKVRRAHSLLNSHHPEEYRQFEGEANLLVWCAWRLDDVHGPVTSWDDTQSNIEKQLAGLLHAKIQKVTVSPGAWDLEVVFGNDLRLSVFCDHVPGDPSVEGNWELWVTDKAITVGPGSQVRIESRNAPVLAPFGQSSTVVL